VHGLRYFIRHQEYFGQLDQYNSLQGLTLVPEYNSSLFYKRQKITSNASPLIRRYFREMAGGRLPQNHNTAPIFSALAQKGIVN